MEHERIAKLKQQFPEGTFLENEPMSAHTSFRIGGPADLYAEPGSAEELADLIAASKAEGVPYLVIGNGSNVLVKDGGIDGLVLRIGPKMARIDIVPFPTGFGEEWYTLTAEAGCLLSEISAAAADAGSVIGDETKGLTGLEFASGIPGSLGGGLFMNAGAYGGELADTVQMVLALDPETGGLREILNPDMAFGYRTTVLQKTGEIAVEATFLLQPADREAIAARIDDLRTRRVTKQPLRYPSAGSFFKRPEGHFAGKLIEDAGFKGYSIGGARISELHAGFLINTGGATAKDVLRLMHVVQAAVSEKFGVRLEPEVRILGRD
jgi:UDP-N-acetylmuramate dehydrogenase